MGPEHPQTLLVRHNLAVALYELGRPDEAEAEFEAVLAARERVLGSEHPQTKTSRDHLAAVRRAAGGPADAETPQDGLP